MPVAAASSRAVRVFRSAEKASIRARTRRAPSQPWTAPASAGILTAVALAMMTFLASSEPKYQNTIMRAVNTVNVCTKSRYEKAGAEGQAGGAGEPEHG